VKIRKKKHFFDRWLIYSRRLAPKQLMIILSIVIGFIGGMVAVLMKNIVFYLRQLLTADFVINYSNIQYVIYPAIGIFFTIIFVKYILRQEVRDGIPNVLYAISKQYGIIKKHNMFSSVISSALTVSFGGSVGLEGPTVVTGAALGSNLGKALGLNYKQIISILGFASAAAMSAIFKAPVAAIVFALEVILFDMTMTALVPLLLASIVAALTSYFFLGQDVLYPFEVKYEFDLSETIYYVGLGLFTAFISTYFIKFYVFSGKIFDKIKGWFWKFIIGSVSLGLLIFLFPSLYGEGYEAINEALRGNMDFIFHESLFYSFRDNMTLGLLILFGILITKVIATSLTFRAGGVGGIFAPTLFIGTMTGLFFAEAINFLGIAQVPVSNYALVGMAGLLSGVVHAPLTAIFLIAEITGGYELFLPIMLVATISFAVTRFFSPKSIYTIQLANRGEHITHNKDQAVLTMMHIKDLIEKDFKTIHPDETLGDLVKVIASSTRNIYPVVDDEGNFYGMIFLDQIRNIMFKPELYNTSIRELMFMPSVIVQYDDDMETVASKFQRSGKYNLVVLNNGKYVGFVSRANVFSKYRQLLKDFSEE
jgi:CIC family chloride channel protein